MLASTGEIWLPIAAPLCWANTLPNTVKKLESQGILTMARMSRKKIWYIRAPVFLALPFQTLTLLSVSFKETLNGYVCGVNVILHHKPLQHPVNSFHNARNWYACKESNQVLIVALQLTIFCNTLKEADNLMHHCRKGIQSCMVMFLARSHPIRWLLRERAWRRWRIYSWSLDVQLGSFSSVWLERKQLEERTSMKSNPTNSASTSLVLTVVIRTVETA